MLVKIYWLSWGFFALAGLLLFAANSLTMPNLVGLGFIAFGLTFMGMMGVLPAMVSEGHAAPPKPAKVMPAPVQETREAPATGFQIFKSA